MRLAHRSGEVLIRWVLPVTLGLATRVNADRRLRELDYRNNAASVLIQLRRRRGVPQIRILRGCPGSARCVAR